MPTLDEVYRKFGEVSEAAQLIETELGNILSIHGAIDSGLLEKPDAALAADLFKFINRQTLGQLLRSLHRTDESVSQLEAMLKEALEQRNRGGSGFSDRGVSGLLSGQYSNRRTDIHEKAKT